MAELSPIDAALRAREYADLNAARNQRLAEQQRLEREQRLQRLAAEERREAFEREITNEVREERDAIRADIERGQRFDELALERLEERALQREQREEADLAALRTERALDEIALQQAPGPDRFFEDLRARDARLRERAEDERLFERQQELALRQADAAIRSTGNPDPSLGRGALVDVAG